MINSSAKTIVTVLDSKFMKGFLVLIYSMLKHNPHIDYKLHIIDAGLSDREKGICKTIYPNSVILQPERAAYKNFNWSMSKPSLQKSFYKLEMFKLTNYDMIVSMDSDMVVLGDISEVFDEHKYHRAPICGVKLYRAAKDELMKDINGGLIRLNTSLLEKDAYHKVIKHSEKGFKTVEQDSLNDYYRGRIGFLPKEYNVEKRMIHSRKFKYQYDGSDAKIIHYVSRKPWDKEEEKKGRERKYKELESIWWRYYEEAKNRHTEI